MRSSSSLGVLIIAAMGAVAAPLEVAQSADLAVKAPLSATPPTTTWTGCYLGAGIGYGWSRVTDSVNYLPDPGAFFPALPYSDLMTIDGAMGGPQVGCDYQPSNQWVVGVVASYDFADIGGSHFVVGPGLTPAPGVGHTFNEEITGFGTVRGRIGWLMTSSLLLYGSGGLAYERVVTSAQTGLIAGPFLDQGEASWKTGWTVGAGLEWKFSTHVSVFAEYMYAELASVTGNGEINPGFAGLAVADSYDKSKINVVKAGFNWRY